ncbi:MAG: flagellin FliC [Deltaproteobacteria bacterium]|nr:MAG: flagellin FliC [Deltaproteobacteria bacterium]
MGLRINTNVPSLSAQRSLGRTLARLASNYNRLSSGERIYRAGDDAAGLAISENLRGNIRGIRQAKRNANDAISLTQVAEGGLNEISNILIRMRELSVQAASDTIGVAERAFTDTEFQQLKDEIDRIARSTEYTGNRLLDGTTPDMEFQIGIHNDPLLDRIYWSGSEADSSLVALGLTGESIRTKNGAQNTLSILDEALLGVNGTRAKLGAFQNRLASIINNLEISDENFSAAKSRIRDVDVAYETAELAKNNILYQAGVSILAQANAYPNAALKLIG